MPVIVPDTHRRDLERAVRILRSAGCSDIFVFGSIAAGQAGPGSDIDLAVRGCPKGKFFQLLGALMRELEHPVDLVSLDSQDAFARHLEKEGGLFKIG